MRKFLSGAKAIAASGLALIGVAGVPAIAMASTASDVANIYAAVDVEGISSTVSTTGVVIIGIALVFLAIKLGKRMLNRV